MKPIISKDKTEGSPKKRWSRSFRIGNKEFLLGASKEGPGFFLVFECKVSKGETIAIRRHLIQKLVINDRIRLIHQSQHKVLKKL